jgi:hypothetical protein
MEKLTYQDYVADPAIRARIDEEVQQMRLAAFDRFIVRPIVALYTQSVALVGSAFSLHPSNGRPTQTDAR